jgi:hypothetical protein
MLAKRNDNVNKKRKDVRVDAVRRVARLVIATPVPPVAQVLPIAALAASVEGVLEGEALQAVGSRGQCPKKFGADQ